MLLLVVWKMYLKVLPRLASSSPRPRWLLCSLLALVYHYCPCHMPSLKAFTMEILPKMSLLYFLAISLSRIRLGKEKCCPLGQTWFWAKTCFPSHKSQGSIAHFVLSALFYPLPPLTCDSYLWLFPERCCVACSYLKVWIIAGLLSCCLHSLHKKFLFLPPQNVLETAG